MPKKPKAPARRFLSGCHKKREDVPNPPTGALETREAAKALHPDLKISFDERLGRGANNVVFRGAFGETSVAVRLPIRGSDTQNAERARKEAALAVRAASIGAGPGVIDLWFLRHASETLFSGLGMVLEILDVDLGKVLQYGDKADASLATEGTLRALQQLAKEGIVLCDLKPQNVMVKHAVRGGAPIVRIIDFGSEFAEAPFAPFTASETPLLGFIATLAPETSLQTHLIATSMLCQLSATTTRDLHSRFQKTLKRPTKTPVHALAHACDRHLTGMRLSNIALVRKILRKEQFRTILRHYSGRHNSGTRRTFRFARGII